MKPPLGILHAGHTHLYPGARLRAGRGMAGPGHTVLIEFADLCSATARIEVVRPAEMTIAVAAYRTAKGTAVTERRWQLEALAEGEWRVCKRLPSAR